MRDRSIIQIVALIVLGCIAMTGVIVYGVTKNEPARTAAETQRITACVNSGGSWTDINSDKDYVDMGCVQK